MPPTRIKERDKEWLALSPREQRSFVEGESTLATSPTNALNSFQKITGNSIIHFKKRILY